MNKTDDYTTWKAKVKLQCDQLRAVDIYLNEEGKDRMVVFTTLLDLAAFCETAADLLTWIESQEAMSEETKQHLSSFHAKLPIRRLRKIVQQSGEGRTEDR